MALRPVLQFPDPRLKRVSKPIAKITDEIRALAGDMLEVMYDEPGIGLAAPQVGEPVRLFVMDTTWTEEGSDRSPIVVVNPEIVEREGTITWNEGCLSVPDFQAEVERAARVRLRGLDLDGHPSRRRPASCARSASSTRSTTWTASSSSTASVA